MKTKNVEITARPSYNRHTPQFKGQASARADRDGIPTVAQATFGEGAIEPVAEN
jgi:hypothetical protein